MKKILSGLLLASSTLFLGACQWSEGLPMNAPYAMDELSGKTVFSSFSSPPKHLDPARAYSSNEIAIIGQIYEPPLQYAYLAQPYALEPLTLVSMPEIERTALGDRYRLRLKPGVRYQSSAFLAESRTLKAEDYVNQIKRLAYKSVHSPIAGMMAGIIDGFGEFSAQVQDVESLLATPMRGLAIEDEYTFTIQLKSDYPQFIYWLAMTFFAPMPAELIRAEARGEYKIDWQPLGTGPFALTTNNPNREMILSRHPHFHSQYHPMTGEPLPRIDRTVYKLEKETIPYWNKFLQGYFDISGVSSDAFEQAITLDANSQMGLTDEMKDKGMQLVTQIAPSTYYMGFNMRDARVGGDSAQARAIRQAVSILLDYEEYIRIFANGRGIAAQGPLPPGIWGYRPGACNPVVYQVEPDEEGLCVRRTVSEAKALLANAGVAPGLTLSFDTAASGPDDKARLAWMRKKLAAGGIELNVRSTDYNRFQEKMRNGSAQMFEWGWNADYPDPENFFFLLYGPNAKVDSGGENAANFSHAQFDAWFKEMKAMPNGPQRQELVDQMVALLQVEAPWIWGLHPKSLALFHGWVKNVHANPMVNNGLKYRDIDPAQRMAYWQAYNAPALWPLALLALLVFVLVWPALRALQTRASTRLKTESRADD
jgi:ABC-type transport system substrate-binding protein